MSPLLIVKTKQPYYISNKFLMIKQINTLEKAVHKILSDSNSSRNDKPGGNRDKGSNNEVKGQNKFKDDNNSKTKT
jgi:hypothetical protein